MNSFTAVVIIDVCLMVLIGVSVYWTKSAWPLWALLFLFAAKK